MEELQKGTHSKNRAGRWEEKESSSDTVTKWLRVKFLDTYLTGEGTSKRWQEVRGR